MRVALDATPLTLSSGGLTRYTSELSQALEREFPEDEFTLISDQPFAARNPSVQMRQASACPLNILERRWWLWGVHRAMSRIRAGLFHGTNFTVPFLPLRPSVLTLHDLSPWMDPAWHGDAGSVRQRTPLFLNMGIATIVVTDTEAVRRQAIDYFRLQPDRIVAVPLAAPEWLVPPPPVPLVGGPYFLYIGTLEPRKNLHMLIDSWRPVYRETGIGLTLAGRCRLDFPPIPPEPGLIMTGEVCERELASLYS
ncbi:MAG: glycosyltransferase, partial [Bryobacteraceae bacterium]